VDYAVLMMGMMAFKVLPFLPDIVFSSNFFLLYINQLKALVAGTSVHVICMAR
jgi:hypothetical protein